MTSIPSSLTPPGAGILSALEQAQASPVTADSEKNKGTLADRLTDQVEISKEARGRLAKDKETSDELSELSERMKKSADGQQDAQREAKKQEIKREIEALKQQIRMAGPEQAEALARKLGQLAADLKQLASDTASASSDASNPVNATSSQVSAQPPTTTTTNVGPAAPEGAALTTAQTQAEGTTPPPASTNAASDGQTEVDVAPSRQPQTSDTTAADEPAEAPSEDTTTPLTDREKTVDAFEQIFAERQQSLAESDGRRQETDDLKFMAQELKLLAAQIEDKLERQAELEEKDHLDQSDKDLKKARNDIDEVLSTGDDASLIPAVKPIAPIAEVQAYINVQEFNVKV